MRKWAANLMKRPNKRILDSQKELNNQKKTFQKRIEDKIGNVSSLFSVNKIVPKNIVDKTLTQSVTKNITENIKTIRSISSTKQAKLAKDSVGTIHNRIKNGDYWKKLSMENAKEILKKPMKYKKNIQDGAAKNFAKAGDFIPGVQDLPLNPFNIMKRAKNGFLKYILLGIFVYGLSMSIPKSIAYYSLERQRIEEDRKKN